MYLFVFAGGLRWTRAYYCKWARQISEGADQSGQWYHTAGDRGEI